MCLNPRRFDVSPVVEQKKKRMGRKEESKEEKKKEKREKEKNGIKKGVLFGGRQCNTLYASYNFVIGIHTLKILFFFRTRN